MNYVALGVIAEIDDLYGKTLYNNSYKRAIEDNNYNLRISERTAPNRNTNKWYHLNTIFYFIVRTFYEIYYYYFMPFSVIILSFIYQRTSSDVFDA